MLYTYVLDVLFLFHPYIYFAGSSDPIHISINMYTYSCSSLLGYWLYIYIYVCMLPMCFIIMVLILWLYIYIYICLPMLFVILLLVMHIHICICLPMPFIIMFLALCICVYIYIYTCECSILVILHVWSWSSYQSTVMIIRAYLLHMWICLLEKIFRTGFHLAFAQTSLFAKGKKQIRHFTSLILFLCYMCISLSSYPKKIKEESP